MQNKVLDDIQNEIMIAENEIKILNVKIKKLHLQEAKEKYSKLFPIGSRITISNKEFVVKDYTHNYGFPTLRVAKINKDGESKQLQDLYSYVMNDLYDEAIKKNEINS